MPTSGRNSPPHTRHALLQCTTIDLTIHHDTPMITRRASTCLGPLVKRHPRCSFVCKPGRHQQRRLSTSAPSPPAAASQSPISPLASITSDLDRLSPRFDVPAESIEILRSPNEFYETLKVRASGVSPNYRLTSRPRRRLPARGGESIYPRCTSARRNTNW